MANKSDIAPLVGRGYGEVPPGFDFQSGTIPTPASTVPSNVVQSASTQSPVNTQPGTTGNPISSPQQAVQPPVGYSSTIGNPSLQQPNTATQPRFTGDTGSAKDAAAIKFSQSIGVDPLKQKYKQAMQNVKGEAPASGGDARTAISEATANIPTPQPESPVTKAINDTTTQLLSDIAQKNSFDSTTESVTKFYNETARDLGIPELQTALMHIDTVMNGTDTDVRNEITASGGFATESQVEGVVAARNKTLILQANNIQNSLSIAQQNLGTMTSNFSEDRQLALTALSDRVNGDQTALALFQNIRDNSKANYDKVLTVSGWTGLAQEDPSNYPLIEETYGLTPGTLSDPVKVQNLQNSLYKTQSAALQQQRFLYTSTGQLPSGTGQYGTATSTVSQLTGLDPTTPLSQVDPNQLIPAIIKNEGGSPTGVVNNPGNIKFTGLPGQIDSGVKASDGGTFASYSTPQEGQNAIANIINNAASGSSIYGQNPTLGDFIDKYTNTAPQQLTPGTTGSASINPNVPGYASKIVAGRLTQAAIDQAAVQYATTGTLPTGSRSSSGVGAVEASAIKNRAAELNSSGNIAANKAKLTALSSSLKTQVDYQNTIQRSINTVDDNIKILQEAATKVNDSSAPIINQVTNSIKLQSGDGALNAFKAAIQTVRSEYGNILARGGTVTDTVRGEASSLIPDNISLDQLNKVIGVLNSEGQNVSSEATNQVNQIQQNISSIVSPDSVDPQQTQTAATKAGYNYYQMKADGYSDADIMNAINNNQ